MHADAAAHGECVHPVQWNFVLVFQQMRAVYCHLEARTSVLACLTRWLRTPAVWVGADFEGVVLRQDDGLKGGPVFVGQLMERLLLCPAALQQGAADHAGGALQAGAEAQGHV